MDRTQRQGMVYILMAVTGYSVLPILTKHILASGLPPLDMATWRFAFATPAIWLLITVLRRAVPSRPLPRYHLLGLGFLLAAAALAAFFGLQYLPASTYVVLFYTYPTMVALMSAAMGERLPPIGWVALGLTLTGIILTVPDFGSGLSGNNLIGVVLALINAFVVAIYFIINGRLLRGHAALARASAWAITGAMLVMFGVTLVRGEVNAPANMGVWGLLVVLALFSTVMPIFSLLSGIQKLGAARAAIMGTIEPILTLTWATLLLGEKMQPVQLLGAALVLGSVIMLQTWNTLRPRKRIEAQSPVSSG